MPSDANVMGTKRNVVLYLDRELVQRSKELGFNLSKTLENHLKQLMKQFSTINSLNNPESPENKMKMGLPGFGISTSFNQQFFLASCVIA